MEYKLIRKNRKTMAIKISDDGKIVVYAPLKANIKTIENILIQKSHWIDEVRSNVLKDKERYGDSIPFLGTAYKKNIIENNGDNIKIEFNGTEFNFYASHKSTEKDIKEALYLWYRKELSKILDKRINYFSKKIGAMPGKVSIRSQKTIWGSCSRDNNLSINFKLALAPPDVIDYIIVHEMCHIIHKNHSKEFWNTVRSIMPEYEEKKEWLRLNGRFLILF